MICQKKFSNNQMVSIQGFVCLLAFLFLIFGQEVPKLVLVQQVFRHGARYPENRLYPYLDDQFAVNEMSSGELTSQGRSMHYLLGKKMYDTYWMRLFGGTSNQNKYNQSKFYVKSTDVNRTIQSAQSHLYGILQSLPALEIKQSELKYSHPPYPGVQAKVGPIFGNKSKFYRPTAVHVDASVMTPLDHGDFLATFMSSDCPNQHDWMAQNSQNPRVIEIQQNKRYQSAFRELQKALNIPTNYINSSSFYKYFDNLKCMQFLGKKVPDLIVKPSETKFVLDNYYSLGTTTTFYYNDIQRRATATGFFQQTINNFKAYIDKTSDRQWILYSAHDVTLGTIMAGMNLWSTECIYQNLLNNRSDTETCISTFPIFSTVMVFQLYEYSNKVFTFKINYNGKYLGIPFCDYKTECSVDRLQQWFQSWKVKDVRLACGVFHKYKTQITSSIVGTVLAVALIILIHFIVPNKTKKSLIQKWFVKKVKSA